MKCVVIFVYDVCCTSENPMPVSESVWSMYNTMQTGRYDAWLSTVAGHVGTRHVHYRRCVAYRHIQLLMLPESYWVLHRIVWDQLDYTEVCVNWVQRIPQMMTKLIVWAFLVSIWHVTLIKEGSFETETWLITQNLKPEKGCAIENLSTSSSKGNGNSVISKDDHEKLPWDHNCACFGFPWLWWHCGLCVVVVHLGTAAIFCKRPQLLRQSIFLLHENRRHYTPNLKTVYGCTSDRLWISPILVLSVLYLTESLRSTWLASDCNRCWCEASYHLLATDTRQQRLYPGI